MPTTPIRLLRFPDGDVEYRTTRGELPVGAVVRARGVMWRVKSHRAGAAILEVADAPIEGASGSAIILPDALGDTPLTLEVLTEA